MKAFLLALGLSATLLGCGSKGTDPTPTTTDPLLGHWQSQSLRSVKYDPKGVVLTDETRTIASQLDVTATTMTFTTVQPDGKTSVEVDTYVRNGEVLTLTPAAGTSNSGGETTFVRSLTATTFSLEFDGRRVAGSTYYIQTIPYRR